MFLVNSRYLLFFVTHRRVFLIPKLRNHFAEFLHLYFLVTLVYSTFPLVSVIVQSLTTFYLFSILFTPKKPYFRLKLAFKLVYFKKINTFFLKLNSQTLTFTPRFLKRIEVSKFKISLTFLTLLFA